MSVSGGVTGLFDSQEALSHDASDVGGSGRPPSSPDEVGKASKQRAECQLGAVAGALQKQKRERVARTMSGAWKALLAVVLFLNVQHLSMNFESTEMQMSMIRVSAALGRVNSGPHASMQVALHVTMRQNGAKASNRVSVSGGVTGLFDSQEALSHDASDGGFIRWIGGCQPQRHT